MKGIYKEKCILLFETIGDVPELNATVSGRTIHLLDRSKNMENKYSSKTFVIVV